VGDYLNGIIFSLLFVHFDNNVTVENNSLTGDKITIQAIDFPDNLTEKEQML
jgi:hypothetical protein